MPLLRHLLLSICLLATPLWAPAETTENQSTRQAGTRDGLGKRHSRIEHAKLLHTRAYEHVEAGEAEKALAIYQDIDRRYGSDPQPAMREQVAWALVGLGYAHGQQGRRDKAIAIYQEIDQRYRNDQLPAIREQVARALIGLGYQYGQQGRRDKAIATYQEIDRRYRNAPQPELHEQVTIALFNLGVTYYQQARYDKEIATYQEIDTRYGNTRHPAVRKQVAMALLNLGVAYNRQGRHDKEITTYQDIDTRFGNDELPEIRQQVVNALVYLGDTYAEQGQKDKGISVYLAVEKRYRNDPHPAVRQWLAQAMNGLGFELLMAAKREWANPQQAQDRLQQAMKHLQRGLRRYDQQQEQELTAMLHGNLGYGYFLQGKHEQAETRTRSSLRLGGKTLFDGQLADARRHRIEPLDSDYEALLKRLWQALGGQSKGLTPAG
ncbi:tetratricopeptide repeat protein [Chitinilyticum litopenaei]|uniref:tetratricopeptide repeat protein n=1 Tax=Chitinilyticum litopenaei TaxID=1121276 RepID=UPI00041B2A51|nr:tetratricopeptide repeat protein [Chitinilyticum litopenaei]